MSRQLQAYKLGFGFLYSTKSRVIIQSYFRSGWAFLIPYLASYILYAALGWPVNPLNRGATVGISAPCLLHIFETIHGIHLLLGVIALAEWWPKRLSIFCIDRYLSAPSNTRDPCEPADSFPRPAVEPLNTDSSGMPLPGFFPASWICLALIFWIAGVYFEYPADSWEHYRRINEWHGLETVGQFTAWKKSSYFLAYSLVGSISQPLRQLEAYNVYYTACCLLLCWQYFRLARALGLSSRASLVFVFIQTLIFGNNLFGFYRYYGMSSAVFSQLGAMALIRMAIETSRSAQVQPDTIPTRIGRPSANYDLPAPAAGEFQNKYDKSAVQTGLAAVLLIGLVVFSHIQGLGIAAIGIAAVAFSRVIAWRRSTLAWLILIALLLSAAAIFFYPRSPDFDSLFRTTGWLTPWYGLNLFLPSSPANERAVAIIGLFGLSNIFAGVFLINRNHAIGWLTLMPIIALSLPFVAIPFLEVLARSGQPPLVYHRMLFAIPSGLAIVGLFSIESKCGSAHFKLLRFFRQSTLGAFVLIIAALLLLTLTPPSNPYFNRLYNTLMVPPADLSMHHVLLTINDLKSNPVAHSPAPMFVAGAGTSFILYATGLRGVAYPDRVIYRSSIEKIIHAESDINNNLQGDVPFLYLPQVPLENFTSISFTGYLSGHWLPQEAALEQMGGPELERLLVGRFIKRIPGLHSNYYLFLPEEVRGKP